MSSAQHVQVCGVSYVNEVVGLLGPSASGVVQLEGPQEVVDLLEVGTQRGNLVHDILNADDAKLAKRLLDDGVVRQAGALARNLAVSALVDELADGLERGGTAPGEEEA